MIKADAHTHCFDKFVMSVAARKQVVIVDNTNTQAFEFEVRAIETWLR